MSRSKAKPKWAWFLDGKDVDQLTHKQLQSACKKARVGAAGSSQALRASLHAYSALKEAPLWFVDGMEHGDSATKIAVKARTVTLTSFAKPISLRVGQRLEHVGRDGNRFEGIARLVSAMPEGCLVERHRRSQAGSRSGFIGGQIKDTATFEAEVPGVASVALLARPGFGRPLVQQRVVKVTVLAAG